MTQYPSGHMICHKRREKWMVLTLPVRLVAVRSGWRLGPCSVSPRQLHYRPLSLYFVLRDFQIYIYQDRSHPHTLLLFVDLSIKGRLIWQYNPWVIIFFGVPSFFWLFSSLLTNDQRSRFIFITSVVVVHFFHGEKICLCRDENFYGEEISEVCG